jgi:hypothetical protein
VKPFSTRREHFRRHVFGGLASSFLNKYPLLVLLTTSEAKAEHGDKNRESFHFWGDSRGLDNPQVQFDDTTSL